MPRPPTGGPGNSRCGVKLIWFEATAICQEGRANPRQLWLSRPTLPDFARLHEMMLRAHGDDSIPLQLTHSGRYSHPRRIIAYQYPAIDRKTATPPEYPVIADDDLERLEDRHVEAAGLALEAGFRAIDLKVTHGYLLAELLGASTRGSRRTLWERGAPASATVCCCARGGARSTGRPTSAPRTPAAALPGPLRED